ncbi:hypothetical protein LTR53_008612 [Teratosphaeriaceae sp. CCFEE 6253]|nr:hypothetical protein LTR53_008612 [Teratosphaeriaceae sp. CCFEE 6253]
MAIDLIHPSPSNVAFSKAETDLDVSSMYPYRLEIVRRQRSHERRAETRLHMHVYTHDTAAIRVSTRRDDLQARSHSSTDGMTQLAHRVPLTHGSLPCFTSGVPHFPDRVRGTCGSSSWRAPGHDSALISYHVRVSKARTGSKTSIIVAPFQHQTSGSTEITRFQISTSQRADVKMWVVEARAHRNKPLTSSRKVMENGMVSFELFPGKSGEEVQGEAQKQAQGAADQAQGAAKGAAQQAQSGAKGASDTAQGKAQGLQKQAGQAQKQGSEYVKGMGDGTSKQGKDAVDSSTKAAHGAVKDNLPEGAQGYAGTAVDYAGNLATGTVGTLGGTVKDLGDTVGNAGASTAAGLGNTGYNLASGLGSAVTGGGKKAEQAADKAGDKAK